MFEKTSGLARIWARQIESGRRSFDDIPDVSNLREVVIALVEEG